MLPIAIGSIIYYFNLPKSHKQAKMEFAKKIKFKKSNYLKKELVNIICNTLPFFYLTIFQRIMAKSTLLLSTLFALFCSFSLYESIPERILYDFQNLEQRNSWFPLNDNVMGGISTGKCSFSKQNTLVFSGKLSLENRGGFASIRSLTTGMNLKDATKFKLKVKGDGRFYNFNISSSNFIADPGFQAGFQTKKNTWQEIEIALKEFSPAFGSRSSKNELDMSTIKIMGLILSDKQAGPFHIEVDWIKAS